MKTLLPNVEWIQETTQEQMTALDIYLKDCYGNRRVTRLGRMMNSDMGSLIIIIHSLHGVEWDRLWASYKTTYNPVWNVDGKETTTVTRTVSTTHKGTDTYSDSGSDTATHSGTDTYSDGGSDMTTLSGTDTYSDSGSDSTTHSGTDTYSDSGTDRISKTDNGNSNVITKVNGFDGGEVNDNTVSTTTSSEETDSTTYGKTNTNTKNLKDDITYGKTSTNTKDLSNSTKYGKTSTNTKDLTDTTTYGKTNTNTKDLTDTETETTTTENTRGGNIGVTMTQQMLEADLSYWTKAKAQFYRNVIREIVDEITYSIVVDYDDSEMSAYAQTLIITALLNDGVPIAEVDTQTNTVNTLIKNGVPVAEAEVKNG
jgi:hypothetical protein